MATACRSGDIRAAAFGTSPAMTSPAKVPAASHRLTKAAQASAVRRDRAMIAIAAFSSAKPSRMPLKRAVVLMPEAMPARSRGTDPMIPPRR